MNKTVAPEEGESGAPTPSPKSRRSLDAFGDKTGSKWTKPITEYRQRKAQMDAVCSKKKMPSNYLSKFARTHIHVDDAHQAMYCLIPKVSSTNWLRMLVNISSEGENKREVNGRGINLHGTQIRLKHGIVPLDHYGGEDFLHRVNNYTKVIIVRDPFHRWLSGFRQKFASVHYKPFAQRLIKTYRNGATMEEIQEAKLRFDEFLEHLVRKGKTPLLMDQHWAPYSALCDPCYVKYDIVTKLETLSGDLAFLRDYVFDGAPQAVMPQSDQVQTKSDITQDFYTKIPEALIKDLTDMFQDDFTMFGYSMKSPAAVKEEEPVYWWYKFALIFSNHFMNIVCDVIIPWTPLTKRD